MRGGAAAIDGPQAATMNRPKLTRMNSKERDPRTRGNYLSTFSSTYDSLCVSVIGRNSRLAVSAICIRESLGRDRHERSVTTEQSPGRVDDVPLEPVPPPVSR